MDATVIEKLLKVEKLLGYKPDPEVGEYFVRFMQRYMKESATVLRTYFGMELKVAELEHLNDGYKGYAEDHKKLSLQLESAKADILEKNL